MISNYSELQTAVANWLHRGGLSDRVDEFIVFGEARIGRDVRARQMEARVSTTPTDQYVDLPSDYLEMRAVRIKGSQIGWLKYITPETYFSEFASATSSNRKVFTIFGDELVFPNTPDGDVELWYFKKLASLSTAVNSLFTGNPDLYLYAAMTAAQPFLKNLAGMPAWEALYLATVESVNKQHKAGRYTPGMAVTVA